MCSTPPDVPNRRDAVFHKCKCYMTPFVQSNYGPELCSALGGATAGRSRRRRVSPLHYTSAPGLWVDSKSSRKASDGRDAHGHKGRMLVSTHLDHLQSSMTMGRGRPTYRGGLG